MTFGNPFGAAPSFDPSAGPSVADLSPEAQKYLLAVMAQQAPAETPEASFFGAFPQSSAMPAPAQNAPAPAGPARDAYQSIPALMPKMGGPQLSALDVFGGPQAMPDAPPANVMMPRAGGDAPGAPLLAGVLGGAPSMNAGQMPAPQMPGPAPQTTGPANSASAPDASPLARLPTLLDMKPPQMPPQMPPDGNNGRPPGIPPTATPASAAAGAQPDAGDGEDTPPNAGLGSPKPPTAYTGLPPEKPTASPAAIPGAPAPAVSAPPAGSLLAGGPGSTAAPGQPSRPANVAPTVAEPSIWKKLADAGIGDQMIALGAGIAGGRNWGEGLSAGFGNVSHLGQVQAASRLAQAKSAQEQAQLLGNANLLKRVYPQLSDQELIGMAGNSGIVTDALKRLMPNETFTTETDKDGNLFSVNKQNGQKTLILKADEDKTVTPMTEDERIRRGLPPGVYEKDAHGRTITAATPPVGPADVQEYEYAKKNDGFTGTFQDFIDRKGAANRAQTTINNAVNPILKGAGDNFDASRNEADAAAKSIRSIHNARAIMDDPKGIISGYRADDRLAVAKLGSLVGITDPSAVQNTETLRAALKPMVLSSIKALGANPTDRDLKFAEAFSGGQIELDPVSIRRILDLNERAARETIARHNALADEMQATQPELKQAGPMLRIKAPPAYGSASSSDAGAAQPTAPQAGTETPAMGPLDKARAAIAAGADPNKVKTRLLRNGIDPRGL